MKLLPNVLVALSLAAALTACKKADEAPAVAEAPAAATSSTPAADMAGMSAASDVKSAKGSGTISAIDRAAGTVTIDHAPIPEISWPAMNMAFKVAPDVIKDAKVGDKIAFDMKLENGASTVMAIEKR